MPYPTIHFNPTTGSDTAASGAGPGDGVTAGTAITGTGAASTAGASTTIALSGAPNLSGVLATGVHAIYLNTTTGRRWSMITAVDNVGKTVTVADSFNIATPVDYAIGGKRNTINATSSRLLFTADIKPGWTVDLEDGTYTLTSELPCSGTAALQPITVKSSTVARATITTATDNTHLFRAGGSSNGRWRFQHLLLTSTATVKAQGVMLPDSYLAWWEFVDCVVDGLRTLSQADNGTFYAYSNVLLDRCEIKNCTDRGFTNYGSVFMVGCYIHDNASHGLSTGTPSSQLQLIDCIFANNGGAGLNIIDSMQAGTRIHGCTFAGNTSHGANLNLWNDQTGYPHVSNCIFYGNGGKGLQVRVGDDPNVPTAWAMEQNCAYGANVGGDRQNITAGIGSVTLTGNPFTNSGARDFTLNSTAGAGAACRGMGYPGAWPSATMTGARSIGALEPASSGGGSPGTPVILPGGGPMIYGGPMYTGSNPGFYGAYGIAAASPRFAYVFQIPKTGTLDRFGIKVLAAGQVPTAGLRFSFQDVSAGFADGTVDQFANVTSGIAAGWVEPSGYLGSTGLGAGAKRAVTEGDWIACVIDFVAINSGDALTMSFFDWGISVQPYDANAYFSTWNGSAWTRQSYQPQFALRYDDGTYAPVCPYWWPATAINAAGITSASTPDEIGLLFQVPVPLQLGGCWLQSAIGNDCQIVLYDAAGTAVMTHPIVALNTMNNAWQITRFARFPSVALAPGVNYRLVAKAGAGAITLYDVTIPTAAHLGGFDGGAKWMMTWRTDAGAWVDTPTRRPIMGLLITGAAMGGGGGGEISVPF